MGEVEVYGWGSNAFGQLGLIGTNIPTPMRIQIPDIRPTGNILVRRGSADYFVRVECGKRNSAIISKQGQVWVCGNYKPDKILKTTLAAELNQQQTVQDVKKRAKSGDVTLEDFLTLEQKSKAQKKKKKGGAAKEEVVEDEVDLALA